MNSVQFLSLFPLRKKKIFKNLAFSDFQFVHLEFLLLIFFLVFGFSVSFLPSALYWFSSRHPKLYFLSIFIGAKLIKKSFS